MRLLTLICGCLLHALIFCNAAAAIGPASGIISSPTSLPAFDYDRALAISQAAIGNQLSNHGFVNSLGKPVTLSHFEGKPLVVSMVYTSCYQVCPMTTQQLSKVVQKARKAVGDDSFAVAVIGFDTSVDTPAAMQYFAKAQGISDKGWNLLSIDQAGVEALSKDLGFQYLPSSNGFDHLIQATIIDAQSKVYRQVYGQVIATPQLVDPLLELILGRSPPEQSVLENLGKKIKLFCTTYDPVRDGYFFDYSLFLGLLIGASIIIFVGVVVIRGMRNN